MYVCMYEARSVCHFAVRPLYLPLRCFRFGSVFFVFIQIDMLDLVICIGVLCVGCSNDVGMCLKSLFA